MLAISLTKDKIKSNCFIRAISCFYKLPWGFYRNKLKKELMNMS